MKVLFYGRLAEVIAPELEIAAANSSVAELRDRLAAQYPAAEHVLRNRRSRAFIADAFVPDDYRVRDTDRIEFLSPVSGG